MKREARLLKDKALKSLVLAVDHFNRPHDDGRAEAVLILLDHAFEMLLKAGILHRGGRIREKRAKETIGFNACVNKALTEGKVKFLTPEQALTLQALNGLRDAAQHYLLELPEHSLYMHAQLGVTLFRDVLSDVFSDNLSLHLPDRVLPVSTNPPKDLLLVVQDEVALIKDLMRPSKRRRVEARARLRALAIFEASTRGGTSQPSDSELDSMLQRLAASGDWERLLPGLASLALVHEGNAIPVGLRITKREGTPVQLVQEGAPGATVVAVHKVNELSYYTLGRDDCAEKAELTGPQATALIVHLGLRSDADFCREIKIGKMTYMRYSQKVVERLRAAKGQLDVAEITRSHWHTTRKRK
jgi:hypothetical protein